MHETLHKDQERILRCLRNGPKTCKEVADTTPHALPACQPSHGRPGKAGLVLRPAKIRCYVPSYLRSKLRGYPTVFRQEHAPREERDSDGYPARGGYRQKGSFCA